MAAAEENSVASGVAVNVDGGDDDDEDDERQEDWSDW